MTNKEYFIAQLGFAPTPELAESSLIDLGLTTADDYIVANRPGLRTAIINALYVLLSVADTQQGTGETINGIKYDRNAIWKRIGVLEQEIGLTEAIPTITGRRPW